MFGNVEGDADCLSALHSEGYFYVYLPVFYIFTEHPQFPESVQCIYDRTFDIILRIQAFYYDFPVSRYDFEFFKRFLVFPSVIPVKYAEYLHLCVETVKEQFDISSARHPHIFLQKYEDFLNNTTLKLNFGRKN